jgi:hypothetical protein
MVNKDTFVKLQNHCRPCSRLYLEKQQFRERKRVSSKIKAREMLISHICHREHRICTVEFCHLAVYFLFIQEEQYENCWKLLVIKSYIFWDVTPRSLLKVSRHFGRTYCLHLQDRRISRARSQRKSRWQANRRLTFNGLQGVMFKKIELFITTSVKTSIPMY